MNKKTNERVGGLLLLGFGVVALVAQFVDFSDWLGMMILPAIGAAFIFAGILSRNEGFMIPGGIISGVGFGAYLIEGPLSHVEGDLEGGIFMVAFSLGWALITVLSAVFTKKTQWWPLIPGSIIALVGAGILFGGMFMSVLTLLGKVWPLFLIAGGIAILIQTAGRKNETKIANS